MLTVAEFYEAYARFYRRTWWVFGLLFILFGVALVGCDLAAESLLERHLRPHVLGSTLWLVKWSVVGFVGVFAFLLTLLVAQVPLWLCRRVARRDRRLVCPCCDRVLAFAYRHVMASRACPSCGREVLVDPSVADHAPLSREQAEARASQWRRSWRRVVFYFGLALVLFLAGAWSIIALKERGVISEREGDVADAVLVMVLFAYLSLAAVRNRHVRSLHVLCPRCGQPQDPTLVAKYGRCGACSQPLVAEPAPEAVAAS
jgi:hypothetical protein